jgi:hypothetical protein
MLFGRRRQKILKWKDYRRRWGCAKEARHADKVANKNIITRYLVETRERQKCFLLDDDETIVLVHFLRLFPLILYNFDEVI